MARHELPTTTTTATRHNSSGWTTQAAWLAPSATAYISSKFSSDNQLSTFVWPRSGTLYDKQMLLLRPSDCSSRFKCKQIRFPAGWTLSFEFDFCSVLETGFSQSQQVWTCRRFTNWRVKQPKRRLNESAKDQGAKESTHCSFIVAVSNTRSKETKTRSMSRS